MPRLIALVKQEGLSYSAPYNLISLYVGMLKQSRCSMYKQLQSCCNPKELILMLANSGLKLLCASHNTLRMENSFVHCISYMYAKDIKLWGLEPALPPCPITKIRSHNSEINLAAAGTSAFSFRESLRLQKLQKRRWGFSASLRSKRTITESINMAA